MVILAVDHGERRLGIAVSDLTGTLSRPLTVLSHISRAEDVRRVNELAHSHGARLVVVGQSFDEDGHPNAAGERARRFAEELKSRTGLDVILWDESLSSVEARARLREAGVRRKGRRSPDDAIAAAVILESFLESRRPRPTWDDDAICD